MKSWPTQVNSKKNTFIVSNMTMNCNFMETNMPLGCMFMATGM